MLFKTLRQDNKFLMNRKMNSERNKELFKINQLWDKFVQSLTIVKSITIINTDLETNN